MAPKLPSGAPTSCPPQCASPSMVVSNEVDPQHVDETLRFLSVMGADVPLPDASFNAPRFYSSFLRSFITVDHIQRGKITCTIVAKSPICNGYGTLHGGAVASLVEELCTACARTVVAEDKELFLGEVSVSYLSSAPIDEVVVANASVVKSGRNLTVVALEFKHKKTGKSIYISHATFYNMPVASL